MDASELSDRLVEVPPQARDALLAVLSDAAGLPGPPGSVRFFGPTTTEYRRFVAGEPPAEQVEVLGITGNHTFRLVVGATGADLSVDAASILQDDVMDALGRPWPEVAVPGGGTTVLEPAVSPSGMAEWRGTSLRCPIGALQQTYGRGIRHP